MCGAVPGPAERKLLFKPDARAGPFASFRSSPYDAPDTGAQSRFGGDGSTRRGRVQAGLDPRERAWEAALWVSP